MLNLKDTMIGGSDVDNSTYYSRIAAGWSLAGLAIQQGVGLLPQRWPRLGSRGPSCIASGRATVTVRTIETVPVAEECREVAVC